MPQTEVPAGITTAGRPRFARQGTQEVTPTLVRAADDAFTSAAATTTPRDSARRRALAAADAMTLAFAYVAATLVAPGGQHVAGHLPMLALLPAFVLLHKMLGLYDRDAHVLDKSTLDELPRLLQAVVLGVAALYVVTPLLPVPTLDRGTGVVLAAVAALLLPASRAFARAAVRKRYAAERALIIGSGGVAGLVARKLAVRPELGVEIAGCLDAPTLEPSAYTTVPHLGGLDDLEAVCRKEGIERVIVTFSSLSHDDLLDVIRASKRLGLKITVVPRLFEVLGHAVELDHLEGMTLLGLRGFGRTRSSLAIKRAIDVAAAGSALVILAPAFALIALAIKLTSPGPVFFAQRRMGRDDLPFKLFKFRTMVVGAHALQASLAHLNEVEAPMFKIAADPRVTRVGRRLRKTNVDELPQLWNVLRGDMSLVGPRPLVPSENEHLIGWHRARLELTPGMTGPWQVLRRTAVPFSEMVALDYLYVADWSLWNDLKLLIRTLPVLVGGRGD